MYLFEVQGVKKLLEPVSNILSGRKRHNKAKIRKFEFGIGNGENF